MKCKYLLKSALVLMLGTLYFFVSPAFAYHQGDDENYCSQTTSAAFRACRKDVQDDFWTSRGVCINISSAEDRQVCNSDNRVETREAFHLCYEQMEARNEVCEAIGESRYDPVIDPADFVDPLQIGHSVAANTYMPLLTGFTRVYQAEEETVTVVVTDETIEIQGVTCVVVRDTVEEGGELIEDTDDWFAQDIYGNVWYFGEISRNYEDGKLVDLDGSWKAGVDGDKAGIVMKAAPEVGDVYRQEWALSEAEDMGEVLSLSGSATAPAASCNGDCLITRDFTPLEPEVNENKIYAPGIGVIIAFDVEEPDGREELIEFHY